MTFPCSEICPLDHINRQLMHYIFTFLKALDVHLRNENVGYNCGTCMFINFYLTLQVSNIWNNFLFWVSAMIGIEIATKFRVEGRSLKLTPVSRKWWWGAKVASVMLLTPLDIYQHLADNKEMQQCPGYCLLGMFVLLPEKYSLRNRVSKSSCAIFSASSVTACKLAVFGPRVFLLLLVQALQICLPCLCSLFLFPGWVWKR